VAIRHLFNGSRACFVRFDGPCHDTAAGTDDDEFNLPESIAAHVRDPIFRTILSVPTGTAVARAEVAGLEQVQRRALWQE
jgi:hypothetical protein